MNTLLLTLANMGVNLDDVADVINNCIPQLIFFGVVVAAAIIVLIAMAVNKKLAKPTKFMVRAQSGLAVLLAFGIMLNLVAFGPMSTMLDLVTGNGTITEESSDEANALCTEIAEEGIVLLQNDDNELPLASGSNLKSLAGLLSALSTAAPAPARSLPTVPPSACWMACTTPASTPTPS